jgi:hypothetical protein
MGGRRSAISHVATRGFGFEPVIAVGYIRARAPMHAYAFVALPREQYPRLAAVSVWISAAAALLDRRRAGR